MTGQEPGADFVRAMEKATDRISRLDNYVHSMTSDIASEVDAAQYLRSVLQPEAYVPPAGGWSAQYKTIAYLVGRILEANSLDEVLELGSGVSTVWMGLALKLRGHGHLTSVEHDPMYHERTHSLIKAHSLEDVVTLRHAPLTGLGSSESQKTWYDVAAVRTDLPLVGLLFVDGPPAVHDPLVRLPAVEELTGNLTDQALVVLDDCHRPGEQEILERWTQSQSGPWQLVRLDTVGRSAVLRCEASPREDNS